MTDPGMVAEPYSRYFDLLFSEKFSPQDVVISWNHRSFGLHPSLNKQIDHYWEKILLAPQQSHLFNGKLCRLNQWRLEKGKLYLSLGVTWYKELLYSNAHVSALLDDYGEAALSRALGVSAVVVSSDAQIVFIKRSSQVGEGPNVFDVLGGHIEPDTNNTNGLPDPFLAMKDELKEEINLMDRDIQSICCTGLIETTNTHKPELLFEVTCSVKAEEIVARGRAHGSTELADILALPRRRSAVLAHLEEHIEEFSSSGIGTLWLYAHDYI